MITWCRVSRCLCPPGLDFPWCLRRQIRLNSWRASRSAACATVQYALGWLGHARTDLDWLTNAKFLWHVCLSINDSQGAFRPQLLQQQAQSTAADLKRTNVRCAKARRVCQHVWTVLGQMSTAKNEAAKSWKRSVGSAKMWYTAKPSNYSWKDTMGFKQCSVSLCKPFSFKYSSSQLLDWVHMWPGWYPCSAFRNDGNDLSCTVLWTVLPFQFISSYRFRTSAAASLLSSNIDMPESVWICLRSNSVLDRSQYICATSSGHKVQWIIWTRSRILRCNSL